MDGVGQIRFRRFVAALRVGMWDIYDIVGRKEKFFADDGV
jgi:hypothetical protein